MSHTVRIALLVNAAVVLLGGGALLWYISRNWQHSHLTPTHRYLVCVAMSATLALYALTCAVVAVAF